MSDADFNGGVSSGAEEVAQHIHGSLLDLCRRVDSRVAIEVARAVLSGAARAVDELSGSLGDRLESASASACPVSEEHGAGAARLALVGIKH